VFQTTAGRSFGIGLSHRDVHEKALKKLGSSFKAAIRDSKRGDDKHNPGSSMNGAAYGKAEQHNREIHENQKAWARKPVLRRAYAELYRTICENIEPSIPGKKVEPGSGMGNIRKHLPECITTDMFPNPWLDRVENAYQLSFSDSSVGHPILFAKKP
jgi:hypothetical protein